MTETVTLTQLPFTDDIAQVVRTAQAAIDRGLHTMEVGYDLVEAAGRGRLDALQQQDLGKLITAIRNDLIEGVDRDRDQDFQQFKDILTRPNLSEL